MIYRFQRNKLMKAFTKHFLWFFLIPVFFGTVGSVGLELKEQGKSSAARIKDSVLLKVGDNFQQVQDVYPGGIILRVASGIHIKQRVVNPKKGNEWIGEEGAIMDGENAISNAFYGRAESVAIKNLELRNYVDNGIYFDSGSKVVIDRVTIKDSGSGSGEENGAVRFDYMYDIKVTNCYFNRVSSGILPTNCQGPIVIEHNTGVNTGRNFIQLAKCSGGGIRVHYNSMERIGDYLRPGAQDVEDWISVYEVEGIPDDYAQINYNRARGHGSSKSGSFIMLGDCGGKYQQAVGNVGVNPGQVGIGLSGGSHIEIRENLMFSNTWEESNVAFYSCGNNKRGYYGHHVVRNNRANWLNHDGRQNTFWTDGSSKPLTVSGNRFPDKRLSEKIWDRWAAEMNKLSNKAPKAAQ